MVTGIGSVGFTPTTGVGHHKARMVTSGIPLAAADEDKAGEVSASPATQLVAQGAPVDEARVAAIKAGIADGSYRVDAQAIAKAMIAQDLSTGA